MASKSIINSGSAAGLSTEAKASDSYNPLSVSRRRLAFRPYVSVKPGKNVLAFTDGPIESHGNAVDSANSKLLLPSMSPAGDLENKLPRRRLVTSWSFQEMLIFYEALKQVMMMIF